MKYLFQGCAFFLLLVLGTLLYAEEEKSRLGDLWKQIAEEGNIVLKKSFNTLSKITDQFIIDLEKEISEVSDIIEGQQSLNMEDKIDSIRLFVEDVGELKKKQTKASSFTIISKSKKDYRIKIDEVLKEIEPVLFDGQVVNYSERIRKAKRGIEDFEEKKVELNEKIIFAPEESSLFNTSKDELRKEIEKIEILTKKSEKLIDKLEFDLKRKMSALGIKLTREQIRIMTTRIDGDDLAKSFAIFDVTKQITKTLGLMMEQNSFSGSATTKYYGIYVILSEILGYSQRQYIEKIDEIYMPALTVIEKNIEDSIEFAKNSIKETDNEQNKKILESNIEANKFSLSVLGKYKEILIGQRNSIEKAVERTNEQIMVAYSTYDTAVNSANLINLISQTQESFNKIMDMQLPEIIPFENSELENKFNEISEQLLKATS